MNRRNFIRSTTLASAGAGFGGFTMNLENYWHWFNHLLVNPSGSRLTFLHRWRDEGLDPARRATGGFVTRMFTLNMDGTEPYIIDPSGFTSHLVWHDDKHITAWTRPEGGDAAFYLLEDKTGKFPWGNTMNLLNTRASGAATCIRNAPLTGNG